MKQMSLTEMDGFLKGECIPSDLEVNETNAKYLARKLDELESRLETALRERNSARITIDNLEAKYTKMVAENTSLEQSEKEFSDFCREESSEWEDDITETLATDVLSAEVRAQGMDTITETAENLVAQKYKYKSFKAVQNDCCMHSGSDLVGEVEMTEQLVDSAAQPLKGGNQ